MKWVDPPPLKSTWDFFELGIFLKGNDPLKILRNKLNMKNIGTKSVNMSDIMVYLAMFITTIDQILCLPSGTWNFFDCLVGCVALSGLGTTSTGNADHRKHCI